MDDQTALTSGAEARFRAVVDGFGDPILIVDAFYVVRYVNVAFLAAFGYTRADLIGRPLDDLLPPDERAPILARLAHYDPARHPPLSLDHRLLARDGTAELVETGANHLHDPDGAHTIILHMRVVTARRRAEATLRASEERYRHLVENSHDLIQSSAPDGRLLFVNRTWLATLGYSEDDLPRLRLWDVIHPDAREAGERAFVALWAGQGVGILRTTLVSRTGAAVEVEGVAVAQLEDGRPVLLSAFLRDVTVQVQQARVQAARFTVTRILAESPELHVAVSRAVEAIATNLGWQAAELWLPDAQAQVLRWRNGWHVPGDPMFAALVEASRTLTFAPGDGLPGRAWASGEVLWANGQRASRVFQNGSLATQVELETVVAVPVVRGHEVIGVILFLSPEAHPLDEHLRAVLADLGRQLGQFAARKAAEAALQAERASLARRVEERTADLSRVNAELARAVRAKDEFLANMSHELRTPLNTILALSEVLLEELRGPLNTQQQAAIRTIEAGGRHLLALINDILDLSKAEAGRLELRLDPVPVADICQTSLLFVRELAFKKELQLAFHLNDQLAVMDADARRLKQMLVNLLSNAVKFTPQGGRVSLEVTVEAEAGRVRFAVQDSGIGIAPEDLGRLFRPFTQLDISLSRQHEGTGLGLALVRRFAEAHGGSISVESEPGAGSRFTLVLPYRQSAAADVERSRSGASMSIAAPEGPDAPAPSRARILLAEDNESNIQVMGDYLRDHGYEVTVARDGREAIDRAVADPPDLILLDIQMPQIDGLEVARHLRSLPAFAATPILAVTALAMPGDRERCLEAGATDYMTKPVSLRAMLEAIRRLLGA